MEPVPTASGFKAYQLQVYTKVLAASKRSSLHTLRWIQEIETAKLKKLEKPKTEEWDDLERVLAEAVMKVVAGGMMKELLNYQNEKLKSGIPLYGRVALWHVFQKFQLESGTALSLEYQNLMSFTLGGDLAGFMTAWDSSLQAMSVQPDIHMLRALLETQLRKCAALRQMFMSIEESSSGLRRREYKYLYESAHREIDRRQSEVVRQQLTNGSQTVTAAAATKATRREERKAAAAKAKANKKQDGQPPTKPTTAAVATTPNYPCRNHALGKCTYGDKCKFIHDAVAPNAKVKPKAKAE